MTEIEAEGVAGCALNVPHERSALHAEVEVDIAARIGSNCGTFKSARWIRR